LIGNLENQHTQGVNTFPITISSVFRLKKCTKLITMVIENESYGIAFAHLDETRKTK